jgi:class 3 adenylate cyclase
MISDFPIGTVTFLFTDIEGSTRLWEGQPGAMQAALARHDDILRNIIEAQGGHIRPGLPASSDRRGMARPAGPFARTHGIAQR